MDAYEATRVVFSRIKILDPENAAKIMGLLLIQDHGEKVMIRLAFGPETLLHSVVLNARKELGLHVAAPPPPPLTVTSPSWAPPLSPFSRSLPAVEDLSPNSSPSFSPFYGGDLVDDMVNDGWGINPNGNHHRRSSSISELYLGWRPCHYYARGYCKNGSSCRFVHGFPDDDVAAAAVEQQCHELLLRSKSQRLISFSPPSPLSSAAKSMSFLLQQQQQLQSDTQRAAAAAAMMMAGDDAHKFLGRSRVERCDFSSLVNPGSRQIYLTFPADSTFREEDVSNYFSIYGPVQDVRIPYQQKRMFGFVTFVFSETVKLILAKGNPHFVCDSRVLVKPYKEKGKIPDKKQQLQGERGDFSGCSSPTGLDLRDHYDLQQLGSRMLYGGNHDVLMRRKLEEQQQQAELQQAIELQNRRFMGLHLLDLKPRGYSAFPSGNSTVSSPVNGIIIPIGSELESPPYDKSLSPASGAASALSRAAEHGLMQQAAVNAAADKDESARSPTSDGDFQESFLDHNLPDSPFASPTKASSFSAESFSMATAAEAAAFSYGNGSAVSGDPLVAPSLLPTSSNIGSFKSCLFSCLGSPRAMELLRCEATGDLSTETS